MKVGFTEDSAVELHSRLEEGYYDPAAPKNGNFQIEEATDWGKEIEVWFIQDDPASLYRPWRNDPDKLRGRRWLTSRL